MTAWHANNVESEINGNASASDKYTLALPLYVTTCR